MTVCLLKESNVLCGLSMKSNLPKVSSVWNNIMSSEICELIRPGQKKDQNQIKPS